VRAARLTCRRAAGCSAPIPDETFDRERAPRIRREARYVPAARWRWSAMPCFSARR
jgi:hypothetical protein